MIYVPWEPSDGRLVGVVEVLFVIQGYSPEHRIERLVPNGRTTLVLELDGRERSIFDNETGRPKQTCRSAWVSGVQSQYLTIGETEPDSSLLGVQFAPGGASALMEWDLDRLNDRVVPAVEVFGSSILDLRTELVAAAEPDAILSTASAWLESRYRIEREAPAVVQMVLAKLLADPRQGGLTELVASHNSVSYKHFVDLFKKHVGPTPKKMQRILRFAQVFEHLNEPRGVDWAALSLELGFSDQAHLIREFRAFSGYRPQDFVDAGHERSNFFPDDPPDSRGGGGR